ncbi:MAG: type IV secretion system DNA-binding domain-containing protein [Anaerolineales bacterium]
MGLSSVEQLTTDFYVWEQRGRGWTVCDSPVEIEPPFIPFYFHYIPPSPDRIVDDARKPTLFSPIADKLVKWWERSDDESDTPLLEGSFEDVQPIRFETSDEIKEFTVTVPQNSKIGGESAERFLVSLAYSSAPFSFEILGTRDSIKVGFACRESDFEQLTQQLRAHFPEAVLNEEDGALENILHSDKPTAIIDFGLSEEFMRPVKTFGNLDPDPLLGLIGAMENLSDGDTSVLQILFQSVQNPWAESMIRSVCSNDGGSFFLDAKEMPALASEKIGRPLFAAVVRILAQGSSAERAWEIAKSLRSALAIFGEPQSNELIPLANDGYDDDAHFEDVVQRQTHRTGMILNSGELLGFVHLPSASVRSAKLRQGEKKTKAAPSTVIGREYVLGENIHQGKTLTVSLSPEERLRHIHIVGATGTGKSTLLLNLVLQDMKQGAGCGVLDPHGDLIDRILELVPDERMEDVILFDPAEMEYPVGFNILEARSEVEKNVMSSDLAALFRRFSTSWGDQMTTVLGNAVSVFLESSEAGTLLNLRRFLIEKDYRNERLKKVLDPEIVYFWEKQFPLLKGAALSSILTRLDIFLRPRTIRNIVGQRKGLDCNEIINGKKIFLVRLAQGLIGEENSYLLGSLLVSKLHQAAMARQAKDVSERQPFYLYIDEFQNFVTPSMAAVLSGARKYGLGLVLAHQDLRQLWSDDTQLANSLMTNPVTRICFRLGDFDAEKLQAGFSFFDDSDLQNLSVGEAILRVERKEYDFNLHTFPAPKTDALQAQHVRENVIALSRKKYGRFVQKPEIVSEEEVERPPAMPSVIPIEVQKTERDAVPADLGKKPVLFPVEPIAAEDQKRREHRYLQTLIKKIAEDRGYRAVIEEQTPDGQGRVDVGLERNGEKLAVEISVTTTEVHELQNIQKCLRAGYARVIVCSPEKKNLKAIRKIVEESLAPADQEKVLFLEPEELLPFFEDRTSKEIVSEQRVKGYRVKVQYQPASETDRKKKDDAVKKVIVQAMRRMKDKL